MNVEWRPIPFARHYEVSNLGGVRRRTEGTSTFPGRELKPWLESNGYYRVTLRINGESVKHWVQRLVAFAFHGDPPTPEHEAAHCDGVSANNRSDNIAWKTPLENSADVDLHGNRASGDRHPGAKLTAAAVADIRARYTGRYGEQTALAREYGVTQPVIFAVVNRTTWVDADGPRATAPETRA
ncbi:endodeoxyribonuclease [Mesorhizobium sp. LNHC220B00]|nr:NUMOD4 domain-containing protein [Mesorhizobium sp. LNHC220B00]ESY88352.1 endodeoxyribonuclease [Mesorhizobium sp. LNHC220B00]